MELVEGLAIILSATAAAAVVVAAHLHRPLRGILTVQFRDEDLAAFWTAYVQVFIVLVPLLVESLVLLIGPMPPLMDARFLIELSTWGLGGLVGSLAFVGFIVAVFGRFGRSPVYVEPEQADDLNRLLERVRELRAREVVRKADERARR